MIKLAAKSWGCGQCGYDQDFNATNEALWTLHILSDRRLQQVAIDKHLDMPLIGKCPACWLGLTDDQVVGNKDLFAVSDLSSGTTFEVLESHEAEAETVPDIDRNGRIPLVATGGVSSSIQIVNGSPTVVEEEVLAPKRREMTDQERQARVEEVGRTLDDLSERSVAQL